MVGAMTEPEIEQYISVRTLAEKMDSSPDTVKRIIHDGELEAVVWHKTLRVKLSSYIQYMRTHAVQKGTIPEHDE